MVQEAIIQACYKGWRKYGNLFMVGDVKQSIYRFRWQSQIFFLVNIIVLQDDGEETWLKN